MFTHVPEGEISSDNNQSFQNYTGRIENINKEIAPNRFERVTSAHVPVGRNI